MERKRLVQKKKSNAVIPPAVRRELDTASIWRDFSGRLLAFIQKQVQNEEDARDILQNVFIKIHQKSSTLKESEKLVSWIFQLTRNAIIDFYRKEQKGRELNPAFLEAEESEWYAELSCCVKPFIDRLPVKEKELLIAVEMEGKKQLEISEESGVPYSTLKANVQRARIKLKKMLVDCCSKAILEKDIDSISGSCGNC